MSLDSTGTKRRSPSKGPVVEATGGACRQTSMTTSDPDSENTSDVTCPTCGRDDFKSEYGLKQHHAKVHGESLTVSWECEVCGEAEEKLPSRAESKSVCYDCRGEKVAEELSQKITKECVVCGTEVTRSPSHFSDNGTVLCSNQCKSQHWGKIMSGESNPCYNRVQVECDNCGEEHPRVEGDIKKYDSLFCSRRCKGDWMSENLCGEDSPRWVGDRVELECEYCGDIFEAHPNKSESRRFCEERCWREYSKNVRVGHNHPMWVDGFSVYNNIRSHLGEKSWGEYTRDARETAGFECEVCGVHEDETGRAHDVHHIVPITAGGTNSQNLLMVMCRSCHLSAEWFTQDVFTSRIF